MLTAANTWKEIEEAGVDTAVVTVGAVEQHGHHLPIGTDWYMADAFGARLAERLGNVLLLPAMPYGCSAEHIAFPGTITLRPATLAAWLEDVVESLRRHGFKVVIVHSSHGGNWIIKPTLREINFRYPEIKVIWANGTLVDEGETPPEDIHSGKGETSGMLYLHPDKVGDYKAQPDSPGFVGQEFNDYLGYEKTTKRGAWGRPAEASAELGRERSEQALEHCVRYVTWVRKRIEELESDGGNEA